MLEVFGLDPVAEAVYAAMLEQPGFGVADLADHLGLDETQVRVGLDELADLTLLRPSRECPGALRAVRPEVGLMAILRRQEDDLARRTHELAEAKAAAARMVAQYADLAPGIRADDGAERLVGIDAIQAKLETLAVRVTRECLSVMPGGGQSQESLNASRPLDADAMSRGVMLLTLYQDSVRNDPATLSYAEWLTEHGGQVRTAPVLPPRMLIFDRETAVVPIDPVDTRRGALCTTEPAIVASLVMVYQLAWETSVPLGADRSRERGSGLAPAELQLLKLLSNGITDEAAAKRLGVSLRTVRRQMACIMERLGATSRFEAGLRAAQRGWLLMRTAFA